MDRKNSLAADLLRWYALTARDLPWRRDVSPYSVLVSEFMLQQTQVATVLPYFSRWMERFPDFQSLAAADEEDLLRLWEGLGYYRRARSLRALARIVVDRFDGELPDDDDQLLQLPGVGPYTAGAIASLAFNRPRAALDGNVERLLTRLFDIGTSLTPAAKKGLRLLAQDLIPPGEARPFNQALMELGALVCQPRPSCELCPLRQDCLARERGTIAERPKKRPRPVVQSLRALSLLMAREDRFLLLRHRPQEMWQGLWEFPTFADDREKLSRLTGLDDSLWQYLGSVRHSYTRYRREIAVFFVPLQSPAIPSGEEDRQALWLSREELAGYPLSAGSRKIRERILPLIERASGRRQERPLTDRGERL